MLDLRWHPPPPPCSWQLAPSADSYFAGDSHNQTEYFARLWTLHLKKLHRKPPVLRRVAAGSRGEAPDIPATKSPADTRYDRAQLSFPPGSRYFQFSWPKLMLTDCALSSGEVKEKSHKSKLVDWFDSKPRHQNPSETLASACILKLSGYATDDAELDKWAKEVLWQEAPLVELGPDWTPPDDPSWQAPKWSFAPILLPLQHALKKGERSWFAPELERVSKQCRSPAVCCQ